jgi:hypothetical protein
VDGEAGAEIGDRVDGPRGPDLGGQLDRGRGGRGGGIQIVAGKCGTSERGMRERAAASPVLASGVLGRERGERCRLGRAVEVAEGMGVLAVQVRAGDEPRPLRLVGPAAGLRRLL